MDAGVHGGGDLAYATWKYLDAGLIDGIVNGVGRLASQLGAWLRILQTGSVRGYALTMLIGCVGLVGFLYWAFQRMGGAQ